MFDEEKTGKLWTIRFLIMVFLHSLLILMLSSMDLLIFPGVLTYVITVDFLSGVFLVGVPLRAMTWMRKKFRQLENVPPLIRSSIRICIPALLFTAFTYPILLQISYAQFYDILVAAYVILGSTFAIYLLLVIFFRPSHARMVSEYFGKLLSSRGVRLLIWIPVGFISGFFFGIGFVLSWNALGFPEILEQQSQVVLWASLITISLLTIASVLGAEQRGSVYHPQIQNYVNFLAKIGKKDSLFLEYHSIKSPPSLPSWNAALTRQKLENMIPWTLLMLSINAMMIPTYIVDMITPPSQPPESVSVMILILILVACVALYGLVRVYYNHVKWKQMWIDLWEVVRLFSLDLQTLGVEVSFTMSEVGWPFDLYDMKKEEKIDRIDKLLTKHSFKDNIPSDSQEFNRLFINATNFTVVKNLLKNPDRRMKEYENEFGLMDKANKLLKEIQYLGNSESSGKITKSFILSSLTKLRTIPKQMLYDIRPLWESSRDNVPDIHASAEEYVEDLMESERSVVPSSLKRFAAIYPIALSVAAIIVLILQSTS